MYIIIYVQILDSSAKPPMIFQHTMKQAGEINIMQKADTKTKKEQAKQKQKLKEFQFKVMTYFQEQQEKEAQQNSEYSGDNQLFVALV